MPVTGKLYDPGAPTALEAALAQTVASGQSPFAGTLLAGYTAQRQQNVAAVNEAQAQSHLLDLANALRQQEIQTSGSVAGAALSSGRGIGPALGAVNKAAGLGMDQGQIQTTRNAIAKAAGNTAVGIVHDATGSPMTPSGDAIQNDPALADQKAQFARDFPGYTLINQNGDPRDVTGPDGKVYRVFRVIDPNGMETTATVEKRQ
jgi:hypothetical protein